LVAFGAYYIQNNANLRRGAVYEAKNLSLIVRTALCNLIFINIILLFYCLFRKCGARRPATQLSGESVKEYKTTNSKAEA